MMRRAAAVLYCLLESGASLAPVSLPDEQCASDVECSDTGSFIQTHRSVQMQSGASRSLPNVDSVIPRKIVQSYRSPRGALPEAMEHARATWEKLNPEFEYTYFTDGEMDRYVKEESRGFPGLTEAYAALTMPAEKADIFRFLVLYNQGGVWADIDMVLRRPLQELLRPQDHLVVRASADGMLEGEWVAAAPRHPVLRHVLERAIVEIKNLPKFRNGTCIDCQFRACKIAGPFQLTRAATDLLFPDVAKSLTNSHYWPKDLFKPGEYEDSRQSARLRVHSLLTEKRDMSRKYEGYFEDLDNTGSTYWKTQWKMAKKHDATSATDGSPTTALGSDRQ